MYTNNSQIETIINSYKPTSNNNRLKSDLSKKVIYPIFE